MNYLEKFRNVHTFIFDIDGVLTDGKIFLHHDGTLLRSMNVRDGYAIRVATAKGYRVMIISGGTTPQATERFNQLGIEQVHLGVTNKLEVYQSLVDEFTLDESGILYMGDDLPDYGVMKKVGLACCPRNSVDEIIDLVHYVSPYNGGDGCARDVIEKVLKLKGDWPGYPSLKVPQHRTRSNGSQ